MIGFDLRLEHLLNDLTQAAAKPWLVGSVDNLKHLIIGVARRANFDNESERVRFLPGRHDCEPSPGFLMWFEHDLLGRDGLSRGLEKLAGAFASGSGLKLITPFAA